MKLKFYKKLYLEDKIENEDYIIQQLKDNVKIFNLYLICVSKNVNHILDIFSLNEAFKDRYRDKEYVVVGMAYGKKQSFMLVKNIFQDNLKDINNMKEKFLKNK